MNLKTSIKYSRASRFYDLCELPIELFLFRKFRIRAIALANGKTLEVGVGTGKNLPYYSPEIELTAIDFSQGMLKIVRKKQLQLQRELITLQEMDVQKLSFKDNTFDTIISTFVFCTVPDPVAGLKELYRVLKPDGKAIFLEHMKSKRALINIHLYMMNIFTKAILGTSMIRETQKNIESVGFTVQSVENLAFDVVRLIVAGKQQLIKGA